MKHSFLLYLVLFFSGSSYVTAAAVDATPQEKARQYYSPRAIKRQLLAQRYQSNKIGKVIFALTAVIIGALVPLYLWFRVSGRDNNDEQEQSITAQDFRDAFMKVSKDFIRDIIHYDDFRQFEKIRQKVGKDILNQPIGNCDNALEYALQQKNNGTTLDPDLLKVLIDVDNQAFSKIAITKGALFEVIKKVSNPILRTHRDLDFLKNILLKVDLNLLNEKVFAKGPSIQKGSDYTALDYFIMKSQPDMEAIDMLLSKEAYVKAQLNNSSEGFKRAIRLAMLSQEYQEYLDNLLEEPTIEDLLNSALFPRSYFESRSVANETEEYTLMEILT